MCLLSLHIADRASTGMVANPARGRQNRENTGKIFLSQFGTERLVSRNRFGSPVPRQLDYSLYAGTFSMPTSYH